MTFCIRWNDDKLNAHEDCLGFYNFPNIGSNTIVSVIKDVLKFAKNVYVKVDIYVT